MGVGSGHLSLIEVLVCNLPDGNHKAPSHKDWSSSQDLKQVQSEHKSKDFSVVCAAECKNMCTSVCCQCYIMQK
jgi:hypothetical protein